MRIVSSLEPAPLAKVCVVADRLKDASVREVAVPSLMPSIARARRLIAQVGMARTEFEERQVNEALEAVGVAIIHTLARAEATR